MIEEAYVSFETAKLLEEKGFNEPTVCVYHKSGTFDRITLNTWNDKFITPICAPTQQMAMRWLREIHKLHVDILYSEYLYDNEPFYWFIERLNEKSLDKRTVKTSTATEEYTYKTYEQALEAAIQYCLKNLI